jgi:hypothetical protein
MASEPNNIENVLRAFAKKRREQAEFDFEMHSATRTVLHKEIAKQWAPSGPALSPNSSWAGWLASYWPRLAFGTGMAAVLAVSCYVWVLNPALDSSHASLESQPERFTLLSHAPVDAPLPRHADPNLLEDVPAEPRSASSPLPKTADNVSSPRQNLYSVPDAAGPLDTLAEAGKRKIEPAASPSLQTPPSFSSAPTPEAYGRPSLPAPSAAAELEAFPVARGIVQLSHDFGIGESGALSVPSGLRPESERLSFVQTVSQGSKLAENIVLSSFSIERNGDEIRIIDADGSVYKGKVTENRSDYSSIQARRAIMNSPESTQSLDRFFIRAQGTNQTLQQPVEVTGEIIPGIPPRARSFSAPVTTPPGQPAPQTLRLNPPSPVRSPSAVPSQAFEFESRNTLQQSGWFQPGFRGQIRIGKTNQIQMEAVPATP